jgi:hypothetical protein
MMGDPPGPGAPESGAAKSNEVHPGTSFNQLLGEVKGDEEALERGFATEFSTGENGPTSEEYDTFIKFLDAKRRLTNVYSALYNASVGWWLPGGKWREYESKSSLPINHAKLVNELLYIHGHQILVDGCFNGDPHPGNSEWRILFFFLTY